MKISKAEIIVTKEELALFIMDQEPSREVDMGNCVKREDHCGCLMLQYADEHLAKYKVYRAGNQSFMSRYDDLAGRIRLESNCHFKSFVPPTLNIHKVKTYADLQPQAQQYLDSLLDHIK